MNIVYIVSPEGDQETQLIDNVCKFEGYSVHLINPARDSQLFKKYYKGGRPAVLVYNEVDKDPDVFYGFWDFAKFLLTKTCLRC